MATHYTANIPFDRIIKIGIWSNQKDKASLSTVYKKLVEKYSGKEVYIANAGFFNMTTKFDPILGLKADGILYANDWSTGYMGMRDNNISFFAAGSHPTNYTDAVCGLPVLIENSAKSKNFSYCIDNSNRGRTMLGYTDNSVVLSCIADVSGSSDFTLDEELTYMLNQKCTYAINLDGGGSVQCNFNGNIITSSRKVNNFIYIIAEKEKQQETVTVTTSYSIGSIIKLKSGAKYYNGKSIPKWVLKSTLYCRAINTNGTVTISTLKSGAITGIVPVQYIEGTTTSTIIESTSNSYTAKVICNGLNIRAGAGTSYIITGLLKKNTICAITCEQDGWGKLADNTGWVSLKYVKKI